MIETTNINKYIRIGWKDMMWYKECQSVFEDLFGKDRLRLVCNLFAATSINSSLKTNIYLFRRSLYEIENGLPIGGCLPNMKKEIERAKNGEQLSDRKVRNFANEYIYHLPHLAIPKLPDYWRNSFGHNG